MSKNLFSFKLCAKFVLTIIVILSITMGISAYYMHDFQNSAFLKNQQKQAQVQANFVASISKDAVLSHDYISLNRIVRELTEMEDVVHSSIMSAQGQVMTTYVNRNDPIITALFKPGDAVDVASVESRINSNENIFLSKKSILIDDETVGYVNIWLNRGHITGLLKSSFYVQLINGVVIILAMSAFIYLVFRINVLMPVRNLVLGATMVAEGNLEKEVPVTSNDELGTLTIAFNTMMRNLKRSIEKTTQSINETRMLNQHLEDRVEERTARLELSQKIALMGQWDYQPGCLEIEVSKQARIILGFNNDDKVTRYKILKRIYLDDRERFIKSYFAAVRQHKNFKIEVRVTPPDTEVRNIMLSARVDYKKEKTMIFGIIQDITEHKKAEASARQALLEKTNAESANKAKSAFLANMSHEIRTPLTAIIGFSEIMLNSCTSPEQQESLETVYKNSKHLLNVINEILDLSKIESEKLEIENINVDIISIFSEMESVMRMQAGNKNISFKSTLKYPLPQFIHTDPVRMKQILFNLVNNAIKFTSEGYVHVNAEYDDDNSHLVIEIIDTGIGISKHKLKNLFTPFTQADSSTTRQYGGTGLGLYISKQLIEMLGGNIHVESVPGLGTKITFYINTGVVGQSTILAAPLSSSINRLQPPKSTNEDKLHGNLLMVDDSEDNRKLVKLLLSKTDVHITTAENGKEAIETALSHEFDLILMDMQMPIMDGIEATKWLRSTGYTAPIVALTANAMKQERQLYLNAGCDDFLSKPIDRETFFSTLAKYMISDIKNTETNESEIYDYDMMALEQEFIDSLPERMQKISDGITTPDFSLAQAECHKLKGIAGAYGYHTITELAGIIESNIKNNQTEMTISTLPQLLDNCQRAYRMFAIKYATNKSVAQE